MPAKYVKSIGRTLDARPDRLDLRDREFTPNVRCLPDQWPDDATIVKRLPQYCRDGLVLDQEREGACTGFGLACVINYLYWRNALEAPRSRVRPAPVSPRMLYHLARFYDEWPGEDYEGSSCRGALKAWHKHGVCNDALWPYRDESNKVRFIPPCKGWAEDALQHRLGIYYRVNRTSIVDLQAAILEIGAIYVSSDVHDGWGLHSSDELTGHDALPVIRSMRNPDSLGGHAYALVGFNRVGFVVQNSWGAKWGACGFAVLPYEEWLKHGVDAWMAALGVPAAHAKVSSTPVRSAERTVIARAGSLALISSTARKPPEVPREVAPWRAQEAYRHTLVMGNEGAVINRIVTLENAAACVQELACDAPAQAFRRRQAPRRLVIYAHGGLNSEDASIERIQTLAPYFRANGAYPLFLTWRTGPVETLRALLDDELKKIPRPDGDVLERVKEVAAEALDRTIEVLARPAAKPIWSQMKQNAQAAAEPGRGLTLLADALAALQSQAPGLEVHLIGHSAGSILLGWLLDLLPSRGLSAASCHLYAPACTVGFAMDHFATAIERKSIEARRFHVHVLSDANELADTVGPYRKSLLYLVSRALESAHKTPVLGLAHAFEPRHNGRWCDTQRGTLEAWQRFWKRSGAALDVVDAPHIGMGRLGRMIQATHGCFDNDAATLELTLRRIMGAKPAFPIEWLDY